MPTICSDPSYFPAVVRHIGKVVCILACTFLVLVLVKLEDDRPTVVVTHEGMIMLWLFLFIIIYLENNNNVEIMYNLNPFYHFLQAV